MKILFAETKAVRMLCPMEEHVALSAHQQAGSIGK